MRSKAKVGLLILSFAATALAYGQSPTRIVDNQITLEASLLQEASTSELRSTLPSAPEPRNGDYSDAAQTGVDSQSSLALARGKMHRSVPPGMGPQPLTSSEKFQLSIRSRFSLSSLGSGLLGAGWQQVFNSRPHYGSDSGAFGQRLAASEVKGLSESFFSYGLYASAFHEDPHYYVMGPGPGHTVMHRAIYSATRVLLTNTDAGNTRVNWSKLAGEATAAGLANAYYPPQDRTAGATMKSFVSSLGTSALGLEVDEFLPDVMHLVFHRHKQPAE